MVVTLKGAVYFFNKIKENLNKIYISGLHKNCVMEEYIQAKSYHNDVSTGTVTITGINPESLKDQEVLIVEDIVDTGLTASLLVAELKVINLY